MHNYAERPSRLWSFLNQIPNFTLKGFGNCDEGFQGGVVVVPEISKNAEIGFVHADGELPFGDFSLLDRLF